MICLGCKFVCRNKEYLNYKAFHEIQLKRGAVEAKGSFDTNLNELSLTQIPTHSLQICSICFAELAVVSRDS